MKKIILVATFALITAFGIQAQPRMVEKKEDKKQPAAIAPENFKAKYEGGMFGYSQKEEGTLKFDDANLRLVFFDKNNKEKFGIPYDAINVIYPNNQSVQTTAGKVVEYVPYVGLAGKFMKSKLRYLVLNFDDPDVDARGTINFKLETTELLESVIQTLGKKAELSARGDAYFRPKKVKADDNN